MDEFSATVFWMAKQGIKINEKIILKCVTQETPVVIEKIHKLIDSSTLKELKNNSEINETEVAEVTIKADKKLVLENFNFIPQLGRFVLIKGEDTVAGGIVRSLK